MKKLRKFFKNWSLSLFPWRVLCMVWYLMSEARSVSVNLIPMCQTKVNEVNNISMEEKLIRLWYIFVIRESSIKYDAK